MKTLRRSAEFGHTHCVVGTILQGATLVELEPATVEVADLRIEEGRIVARGDRLEPGEGDEVVPLRGKMVIPGLITAHHHLYAVLGRGMPGFGAASEDAQALHWGPRWRLQDALDGDASEAAAAAGALDALLAGTTTVFDQHASPKAIPGALVRVARGVNEVGLRAVLSYEVSDRSGAVAREEALEENVAFHGKARGRFRGMIGAHASFTLSNDALEGLQHAVKATGAALHITVAEDPVDERLSLERYGDAPVSRLQRHELLSPRTLAAHVVHLAWPELSQLISAGAWILHNPRANMQDQVGYAPAGKFGARAALGTGWLTPDLFAEAQAGHQRALEAGQPIAALRFLANGHRIASELYGETIGPLREGAVADLVVLDYAPATPLVAQNLGEHLVTALGARHVESVMVDGVWRLWARRPLSVTAESIYQNAREAAQAVWARVG